MGDPYYPYSVPEAGSIHRSSFGGYVPSSLPSPHRSNSNDLRTGAYVPPATVVASPPVIKPYPSVEFDDHDRDLDPIKKRDTPDVSNERPVSERDSNVLFVGGLPNDCTRREVGHLFRPFIGYKDIRVVHKEPRRNGDKAMTLCFVEFVDSKCAVTAMEALQGYKFDDKKPDSSTLKIQFAHFPFRLPADNGQQLMPQ